MKRFRKYFFPICAGFATTVGLVFGYSIVFPPPPNLLVGERFNFAKVLEEKGSEFPGIGFRFDSSNLVGLDGLQKNPDSANNLTLLVVLNPSCKACDISADLYNSVRASAQKINVHYYPCSFIPLGPNFNLTSYAEKFGFDDFLTWNGGSRNANGTNPISNTNSYPLKQRWHHHSGLAWNERHRIYPTDNGGADRRGFAHYRGHP